MIVIIVVTESTRSILRVNVMPQSDFTAIVKSQTKIGRQMDKRTAPDRHTQFFH